MSGSLFFNDTATTEIYTLSLHDAPSDLDLLDPPIVDHHNLVGDLQSLLLIVRDEDGGDVDLVMQAPQPGAQLLAHRSEEHTSELQSRQYLVCRLLLENKKRSAERTPVNL